uniref:Uncharacterized protein n=1 Tax=Solanum tuberosum TaxID=4113 RepID=M0ZK01_SOLTU
MVSTEQRTHKEGSKHEFKGLLIQTNRMEKESTSLKYFQKNCLNIYEVSTSS